MTILGRAPGLWYYLRSFVAAPPPSLLGRVFSDGNPQSRRQWIPGHPMERPRRAEHKPATPRGLSWHAPSAYDARFDAPRPSRVLPASAITRPTTAIGRLSRSLPEEPLQRVHLRESAVNNALLPRLDSFRGPRAAATALPVALPPPLQNPPPPVLPAMHRPVPPHLTPRMQLLRSTNTSLGFPIYRARPCSRRSSLGSRPRAG